MYKFTTEELKQASDIVASGTHVYVLRGLELQLVEEKKDVEELISDGAYTVECLEKKIELCKIELNNDYRVLKRNRESIGVVESIIASGRYSVDKISRELNQLRVHLAYNYKEIIWSIEYTTKCIRGMQQRVLEIKHRDYSCDSEHTERQIALLKFVTGDNT